MARKNAGLRAEVEAAVLAEVERVGLDRFKASAAVGRFLGRGVDRATLFRWADAIMADGKLGQHLARRVKEAAAERAARSPDPAADAAREAAAKLPAIVRVEDVTGKSTVRVVEELQRAIEDVNRVRDYAKTPEGGVRNARLILQAAEVLRRCLDTAVKIFEAMRAADRVDKFHDEIIEAIAEQAPEPAEHLLVRLGQISARWGGVS